MSDAGFEPIEADAATGDRSGLARHDLPPLGQEGYETEAPAGTATVWSPKPKSQMPQPPPPLSERSDSNLTFVDIRAQLYGVVDEDGDLEPLPPPRPTYREKPVTPPLAEREAQFQRSVGPVTAATPDTPLRRGPGRPRKNPI